MRFIMPANQELFPISGIEPGGGWEEGRRMSEIADVLATNRYVSSMQAEADRPLIPGENEVLREMVMSSLTQGWLASVGKRLLMSAGYQVFDDGVSTEALSNYSESGDEVDEPRTPASLLAHPPLANIGNTVAHPRITLEKLRDRVREKMDQLNPPPPKDPGTA